MGLYADFSAFPLSGVRPLSVQFTDESTVDGDSVITDWEWSFGDSGVSNLQNPLHTYLTGAVYSPTLKIINKYFAFQIHNNYSGTWDRLIFANGRFITTQHGGSGMTVKSSTDGITWVSSTYPQPNPPNAPLVYGITWDGSNFIIVGQQMDLYGTGTSKVPISPDGINWSLRTITPQLPFMDDIAFGNGRYLIGFSTLPRYSLNGINFYPCTVHGTIPGGYSFRRVEFVNGYFFMPGNLSGGAGNLYITSTNATDVTVRTLPVTIDGNIPHPASIAYGNGIYVLTRGRYLPSQVLISTDLINWTVHNVGFGSNWAHITFADGKFFMTNPSLAPSLTKTAYSTDGINWKEATIIGTFDNRSYRGIAYGNDKFVTIANNSTETAESFINEDFATITKTDYIDIENTIAALRRRRDTIDDGF